MQQCTYFTQTYEAAFLVNWKIWLRLTFLRCCLSVYKRKYFINFCHRDVPVMDDEWIFFKRHIAKEHEMGLWVQLEGYQERQALIRKRLLQPNNFKSGLLQRAPQSPSSFELLKTTGKKRQCLKRGSVKLKHFWVLMKYLFPLLTLKLSLNQSVFKGKFV